MAEHTNYGSLFNQLRSLVAALLAATLLSVLSCQVLAAAESGSYARGQYVFPPTMREKGLSFAGMHIPLDRGDVYHRTLDQLNYLLMDRRSGIMEWFDRMAVYGPLMTKILRDEGVPEDLIYLAVVLSDLEPVSRTRTGGIGWWALGSAKEKKNPSSDPWISTSDWDDRRDPVASTKIACAMLKRLAQRDNSTDWLMAIAAFVDSSEKIDEVLKKAPKFSFWDLVMPHLSENLIPRLVALKIVDIHRGFYGVDVAPMQALGFDLLEQLKLQKDLPLHVVAKWCGTTPKAIWELNPGVDPSSGIFPKADKKYPSGLPFRVPLGQGQKVRNLLVREGFLAG
jgi:membrane-bound lytic murein transglycosylase D